MWRRLTSLFGRKAKTKHSDLSSRFTEVYANRMWLSEESVSGSGSERESGQVRHAVKLLDRFTRELDIRSIADIPCGDFNWMPLYLERHPQVRYAGYAIVPALIAENRTRFPDRQFEVLDITRNSPAQADLVFSKDMLNHLCEKDVWAALENMTASKPKYLMLTTNRGFENVDLPPNHPHASRYLDLEAAPYSMPAPIYGDHYMLLWSCDQIERRLAERRG